MFRDGGVGGATALATGRTLIPRPGRLTMVPQQMGRVMSDGCQLI